jgi:hypothetical protein
MYCELDIRFSPKHFSLFLELFEHINDKLCLTWWKEPTSQVEYVAFFIGGKLYMLHVTNRTIGALSLVSKEVWVEIFTFVKKQCSFIAIGLIVELENQFPAQQLLNVIGVIYLQYWLVLEVDTTFPRHMALLQTHYGHLKNLGTFGMFVGLLLNLQILDQQFSF